MPGDFSERGFPLLALLRYAPWAFFAGQLLTEQQRYSVHTK